MAAPGIATKLMATLERIAVAAGIRRLTGDARSSTRVSWGWLARSASKCRRIDKRIGEDSEMWGASSRRFFKDAGSISATASTVS